MHSQKVTAKKHLGQHFLNDEQIAADIANALIERCTTDAVLEIGPGMGVLTKYLLGRPFKLTALDIDGESVEYLKRHFQELNIVHGDFLKINLDEITKGEVSVIGNFPYNISSQIVFRILDHKHRVPLMAGMFQKEVAGRICSGPGSREYGILSVLAQTWYDCEYLFTVPEHVFTPPPRVKSGVMRMTRKEQAPVVNEKMLYRVVKAAFNQRRKKLRNAIAQFGVSDEVLQAAGFADKRAEQLGVDEFNELTKLVINHGADSR